MSSGFLRLSGLVVRSLDDNRVETWTANPAVGALLEVAVAQLGTAGPVAEPPPKAPSQPQRGIDI